MSKLIARPCSPGKTSNGYAKVLSFRNSPYFDLWGLFRVFCKCYKYYNNKNYNSDYAFSHNNHPLSGWHNRPAFTLFLVLPSALDFSNAFIIYYFFTFFNIFRQKSLSPVIFNYQLREILIVPRARNISQQALNRFGI